MQAKRAVYLIPAFLLLALGALPLRAADVPSGPKEVSDLLAQAKTQAAQLSRDADEMEAFTRDNLAWESHAEKITQIKQDVNDVGKTVAKMNEIKGTAAYWQRTAINRINPILTELATNTEAIIDHLNREKGSYMNDQTHKDYLKTNAELSEKMASMISDFVDYGETRAKFQALSHKLELSERPRAHHEAGEMNGTGQ